MRNLLMPAIIKCFFIRKITFSLIIFLGAVNIGFAHSADDNLERQLKAELQHKSIYDHQKETKLFQLKTSLHSTPRSDLRERYRLCLKLYEEYSSYKNDSAYAYTQRMYALSKQLQNDTLINESKIKIGSVLIAAGLFQETFEYTRNIKAASLPLNLRNDYYSLMVQAYSDMANYANDAIYAPGYKQKYNTYLDSIIALYPKGSDNYNQIVYFKRYINKQYDQESEAYFLKLLNKPGLSIHLKAMISSTTSDYYLKTGEQDKAKTMLMQAAIFDIQSSTKATLAIYKLALLLYRQGNLEDAYIYLNEAHAEAAFFGARQRQVQINAMLPVVAAQKLAYTEQENNRFLIYLFSVLVLASALLIVTLQLFKQLKKLEVKEHIIESANLELASLNNRLKEDAHIKEEYIGYFFDVISEYIDKLDRLKLNIEGKVQSKRFNEILVTLNRIQVKKERENLFDTFDKVFLQIFPQFVQSFNTLYSPENQIWPKNGGLTVEIRICALMRLGIHDNTKIAKILEYTEKTIYVYKARLKAKSLYPLDLFEKKLMEIQSVDAVKN